MNSVIEQLRALVLRDAAGLTDGELLECYLGRREEAAFEALVRRHGPMVLGVCRRVLRNHHDSEDAFQATFLVLARKAASVVPREMVGNWLYGVAYRTALKAKAVTAKRQVRERPMIEMPEPEVSPHDSWRDLRPLLDQELRRLPDKYRVPIILCALEGRTEKEAARQLGWPQGTLSGRLSRAKTLLAKRLARGGGLLSAGSLTGMLSRGTASACVPSSLVVSTVKAATLFAAKQAAAAGVVSVEVAALTQGVLTAMFLSKVKLAMAVLLVAAIVVGGTGLLMSAASGHDTLEKRSQSTDREAQKTSAAQPAQAPNETNRIIASADELFSVYQTNEALADEKFTGKRVTVSGTMWRIKAVGETFAGVKVVAGKNTTIMKRIYDLEMGSKSLVPPGSLHFRFTEDDRKQLAKLKPNQEITIEGKIERHVPPSKEGQEFVRFVDCKLVNPKPEE